MTYHPPTGPHLNSPRDVWYHIEAAIRFAVTQPGDLAECGVAQGDSSKIILDILQRLGVADRTLHLFDTFAGYPNMLPTDDERTRIDRDPAKWATSLDDLRRRLEPHTNYTIHEGTFAETFSRITGPWPFCFMFVDANLDYSTREAICLADRCLTPGGVLIIHDYDVPKYVGVTRAVDRCLDRDRYHVMVPIKRPELRTNPPHWPALVIALKHY